MSIIRLLLLSLLVSRAMADEATELRNNAMLQLESAFAFQSRTFISEPTTMVNWPDSLAVSIDNNWQFSFKSKHSVNISQITLSINGTAAISNQVHLQVKPNFATHYFFYDAKLQQAIQSFTHGYSFLGIYKQITADDFVGFTTYRYNKLQVTITWSDTNNIYNQSVSNFMLVMAK